MLPLPVVLAPIIALALSSHRDAPSFISRIDRGTAGHHAPSWRTLLLRQSAGLTCPNNKSRTCSPPARCCPGECCHPDLDFCYENSECMDVNGTVQTCVRSSDGETMFGVLCLNDPERTCCPDPVYRFCTADAPFSCVNSDGFVSCRSTATSVSGPGADCGVLDPNTTLCCLPPGKCCMVNSTVSCCRDGTGFGARKLQEVTRLSPAATPGATGSSTPSPSSSAPSPSQVASPTPTGPRFGECPSGFRCLNNTLCCGEYCCSPLLPYCYKGKTCMNLEGMTSCINRTSGESGIENFCREDPNRGCCGSNPDYPYCAKGSSGWCVNGEGFGNCGGKKGNICPNGKCCVYPRRCCGVSGLCCDEGGTGGPLSLLPSPTGLVPASTPFGVTISPVPSRTPPASRSPVPSVSPSPSTSQPPIASQPDSSCFPGHAAVELKDGRIARMDKLQTGDVVRVSATEVSEVFMWTHRSDDHLSGGYVRLGRGGGSLFTATVGHMVYVCRKGLPGCARQIVPVEDVQVGDAMWVVKGADEELVRIEQRELVEDKGLYNPQTMHGDIVVDGVVVTCYTRYVPIRAAHSALTPLRGLYKALIFAIGSLQPWTVPGLR